MVIGYHVETTKGDFELEKQLDNLRFMCTTPSGFNEQKYNCYKEKLLAGYSSGKIEDNTELEKDETIIPIVSPQTIFFSGPKDTPWPMKCHDNHHTSQSPYITEDTTSLEKWRFHTTAWIEGGPVIDSDGTIYFGNMGSDRSLYALYPDGTLKWKYKTGNLIWSTPAIAEDGTIYIGSYDCRLYALYPNGNEKWRFATSGSISSSPAIAEDGTIYFGTMSTGNSIIAVNPNGTKKWSYKTGYHVVSDPAIGDDGTIYIGSGDSYLYALYPNGTLRWRFKTGDIVKSHPSIDDDGTIYFDSFDGYLYALYPNGTIKWKRSCGSGCSSVAIGEDGALYFGSDGTVNKFYAIYPNNGTTKWTFKFGGDKYVSHASPAISADGTIYLGVKRAYSDDGFIYAVNSDGTEKWHKKIADFWVESSPAISEDGTVYVGSSDCMGRGYLHAFGPQETNEPPGTPTITGPLKGKAGVEQWYKFKSIDPDNNPVSHYIEWGDGTQYGWTDDYASGEQVKVGHTWSEWDEYTIRCKSKDTFGEESDWGELTVSMPRSREVQQMLFYRLLEQFPILHRLISNLI